MKSLVIENQYFGCVSYYGALFENSNIILEQCEHFQKMSFRNRCVITGSNGLVSLTVPVLGGREQKQLIKDVKIDNREKWQQQHWRTIYSCYGRSPYFEFYGDMIESFFLKEYTFLWDLNLDILNRFVKALKIAGNISFSENFVARYGDDFSDKRNNWVPKNYRQEPVIKYKQVFEDRIGFQSNLSILDLLLCEGPNAKALLSRY